MIPREAIKKGLLVRLVSNYLAVPAGTRATVDELLRGVATALDKVVLAGVTANSEPEGLRYVTGLQTLSGTSLSGVSCNQMVELSAIQNAPDDGIIFLGTPTVRRILQGRETGTNNGFVWKDGRVSGPLGGGHD